ncbi:MAG: hypothetical protein M0P00_07115 [Bacteroidaceae bacterium]|nr:hypothetical protein [Bacteroidaceae bacterium]
MNKALKKYSAVTGNENSITDIYFRANQTTGQLLIFNDDEENLADITINEWVNYEDDDFLNHTESALRKALTEAKNKGLLDELTIMKPYSFVLVDENKETLTELLIMDDDLLLVDDELLKGLDNELNDFLEDLLDK